MAAAGGRGAGSVPLPYLLSLSFGPTGCSFDGLRTGLL